MVYSQVRLETKYDASRKAYDIVATNHGLTNMTVQINFSGFGSYMPSLGAPYIADVPAGSTRTVCTMSKSGTGNALFQYSYRYVTGCADPKINTGVKLLLPIKKDKETTVSHLFYVDQKYGDEKTPSNWNAYSYSLDDGDTIYSMRRGKVISLEQGHSPFQSVGEKIYDKNRNIIIVSYEDCSFGRYTVFKENGALVNEGEQIEAGQPIAIAAAQGYVGGTHVRYQQYYYATEGYFSGQTDKNESKYTTLNFVCTNGPLMDKATYKNTYTLVDLMQEMSGRERKKFLKTLQ